MNEKVRQHVFEMFQTRQYTITQETPYIEAEYDWKKWFLYNIPTTKSKAKCRVIYWPDSDKKEEKLSAATLLLKIEEVKKTIDHFILITQSPITPLLDGKLKQAMLTLTFPFRVEWFDVNYFMIHRLKVSYVLRTRPRLLDWEESQTKHPYREKYNKQYASKPVAKWLGAQKGQVVEYIILHRDETPHMEWCLNI